MKIEKLALLLLILISAFAASSIQAEEKYPPCDFGKDPYLPGGRGLLPYETLEQSTESVVLAMLGGKHKARPQEKPYFCKAGPGIKFITRPDEENPEKRVATEVYPCFNPIVNSKWGLNRVVFKKSLRDEIPQQAAKAAEEVSRKKPKFFEEKLEKKSEARKCGIGTVGHSIAGATIGYGVGDRDNAIRNTGIALEIAMLLLSEDSWKCDIAAFSAGAGIGYYAGNKHHEKEEREKAQVGQFQAQQDVVGPPPVGSGINTGTGTNTGSDGSGTGDGTGDDSGDEFPEPDPIPAVIIQ